MIPRGRISGAIVSVILGGAAAFGAYDGLARLELGPTPEVAHASEAALAARHEQLDAMEASLREALARTPPKLPRIPKFPPVKTPRPAQPQVVHVVSVAPAPAPAATSQAAQSYQGDDSHEGEGQDGGGDEPGDD